MTLPRIDHEARLARVWSAMVDADLDLLFLPHQTDLEWLVGLERRVPAFGDIGYTHHWVAGALVAPGVAPLLVLPRMIREFDLPGGAPGEVVTVAETDDGPALFRAAVRGYAPGARSVGTSTRTWARTVFGLQDALPAAALTDAGPLLNALRRRKDSAELARMRAAAELVDAVLAEIEPQVVPGVSERELASAIDLAMGERGSRTASFDTGVWSMGAATERDATVRVSTERLVAGLAVSFDFGAVVDGYCSDFGRTVHLGEPSAEFVRVHAAVMAAQEAGRAAARVGVPASAVDAATRAVIDDAGLGEWFRHRTGHCIGMDVHEQPYISAEDATVLAPGMTFTIEPSVFRPGHYGCRVEDVFLVTDEGCVSLNTHPHDLVVTG